jgi:uncharacterized protein involved in response to NO
MAIDVDKRRKASWVFLSFGFRPFFLGAGAFAALAILVWLPVFLGDLALPIAIAPRDWHIHEMVYGYAAAAIAGFLFTAIPNWTGRPPVAGLALLALAIAWIAGRLAMATSDLIGLDLAVLGDLLFLPLVAVVAAREIVTAGNRRNFKLLAVLALLIAGNAVFHVETMMSGVADYGQRFGLATVIGLIVLIGGRIVPNFTRNALVRQGPGRLPEPFGRVDIAAITLSVVALGAWVVAPQSAATAVLALVAGLLQAVRLMRWAGDRARGDWLVLVLHIAYGFIPVGFLLLAAAALAPGLAMAAAAAHAWGAGAVGLMTLAVMTRATLGHTGRPLAASRGTVAVYGLAIVAALARIAAAFPSAFDNLLLYGAAAAWVAAFAGFAAIYGPMMLSAKREGSTGC